MLIISFAFSYTYGQTSAFTYQGKLNEGGVPASRDYDMQFRLFDASGGGNQIGETQTITNVRPIAGIFTVQIDFGTVVFSGEERFLEIGIRPAGQSDFITLVPRQRLTSAPLSIRSLSANDSSNLGGISANEYVQTGDARLSDARTPLPGSNDYVQNTGTPQPSVNFNIGGTGTANILSATTQFNIGGNRVMSVSGNQLFPNSNIFAGVGAGIGNTTGSRNSFFGANAGLFNTSGSNNTLFGNDSGRNSTTAQFNSFFGGSSGQNNTTGSRSIFAGWGAGLNNLSGGDNSFFGVLAGLSNTTGEFNTYIGKEAGNQYVIGARNTFVGAQSGQPNSEPRDGNNNTALGFQAWVGNGLNFATAIGSGSESVSNDTIVIGKRAGTYGGVVRPADRVEVPGSLTANDLNAATQFSIAGNRVLSISGTFNVNTFVGVNSGRSNAAGTKNSFFGGGSGAENTGGSEQHFRRDKCGRL